MLPFDFFSDAIENSMMAVENKDPSASLSCRITPPMEEFLVEKLMTAEACGWRSDHAPPL